MRYIDLHTHTTASDGTFTPIELVNYAITKNLAAMAITDHDTISGIGVAKSHLLKIDADLEVISGIEFSTMDTTICNRDIHILGLYIDENNTDFVRSLKDIVDSRERRNIKMIKALNKLGIDITKEDIINNSGEEIITRAHFAKALLDKGYIKNYSEAFEKYIGHGCAGYVKREKVTPKDAIELILSCGGIPVLAHPTLYDLNLTQLDGLIKELTSYGLMGIEGIYSLYTKSEEKYLNDSADKYDLLVTGGSDFHGENKSGIDLGVGRGNLKVPYSILDKIKRCLNN